MDAAEKLYLMTSAGSRMGPLAGPGDHASLAECGDRVALWIDVRVAEVIDQVISSDDLLGAVGLLDREQQPGPPRGVLRCDRPPGKLPISIHSRDTVLPPAYDARYLGRPSSSRQ